MIVLFGLAEVDQSVLHLCSPGTNAAAFFCMSENINKISVLYLAVILQNYKLLVNFWD